MNQKTDLEIEESIINCLQNKSKHVEWLCQNKTENQLKQLIKRLEKMYEFAVLKQITRHIELIDLWKDEVNTSLKNRSNFENLYAILKKIRKNKKLTSYEKMIADINYDWLVNRIYDLAEDEIKIEERK